MSDQVGPRHQRETPDQQHGAEAHGRDGLDHAPRVPAPPLRRALPSTRQRRLNRLEQQGHALSVPSAEPGGRGS